MKIDAVINCLIVHTEERKKSFIRLSIIQTCTLHNYYVII